jgi:predicted secreted Zn-dependent protease
VRGGARRCRPGLVAACVVAAALLTGAPAAGQVYRWVDANGTVHYAEGLHSVPEAYRAGARPLALPPAAPAAPAPAERPAGGRPAAPSEPRTRAAPEPARAYTPRTVLPAPRTDVLVSTPTAYYAVATEYANFSVMGSTRREILASVRRQNPVAHSLASTWLAPATSYRMSNLGGPCVVTHVQVLLRVVFRYPILYVPGEPPEGLLERWDNFLAIVQRHEHGHRAIAVEHGYEILRRLATLPGLHTCQALDAAASATARQVDAHYFARHDAFDAQTPDNGAAAEAALR